MGLPMAYWYASSGPVTVLPKTNASKDQLVWMWVSPKKTSRSGFFSAWASSVEPQRPAPSYYGDKPANRGFISISRVQRAAVHKCLPTQHDRTSTAYCHQPTAFLQSHGDRPQASIAAAWISGAQPAFRSLRNHEADATTFSRAESCPASARITRSGRAYSDRLRDLSHDADSGAVHRGAGQTAVHRYRRRSPHAIA